MKRTVISKFYSSKIMYNHIINSKPKEINFPKHQHDYIEVLYFLRGNVTCVLNGKEYKLKPHDVIITRPFDEHHLQIEKDVPYERYSLHIKDKLLPQGLLNRLPKDFCTFQAIDDDILQIFIKFDKYYKNLEEKDLKTLYGNLAVELFYLLLLNSRGEEAGYPTTQNPLIEKALTYIKENLTLVPSYRNGREELKETMTITVFGGKAFVKEDEITLDTGVKFRIQTITPNYIEHNVMVTDMLKPRIASVDLVLE